MVMNELTEFFESSYKTEILELFEKYPDERALTVDYLLLEKVNPDLAVLLIENPNQFFKISQNVIQNVNPLLKGIKLDLKIVNLSNVIKFDKLNSQHLNNFISVDCFISDILKPQVIIDTAVFECRGCMRLHKIEQSSGGKIVEPSICNECGNRSFKLVQEESTYKDIQLIKGTMRDTSKILDINLYNDDVSFDKYSIWQKVRITGIYKAVKTKNGFDTYFDCNSIEIISDDEFSNECSDNEYGNRNSPEYKVWQKEILNRDKVCQCCGGVKHPHVHHIYGYHNHEDLRVDLDNGIVLCEFCHNKYHSYYGRDNANPHDLIEFIRRFGVNFNE